MTTSTPGPESKPEACSAPINPTDKPLPSQNARQLLKDLQEKFPVFRDSQPLAIGIDKQLMARLPGLERKPLRIALGIKYLTPASREMTLLRVQATST